MVASVIGKKILKAIVKTVTGRVVKVSQPAAKALQTRKIASPLTTSETKKAAKAAGMSKKKVGEASTVQLNTFLINSPRVPEVSTPTVKKFIQTQEKKGKKGVKVLKEEKPKKPRQTDIVIEETEYTKKGPPATGFKEGEVYIGTEQKVKGPVIEQGRRAEKVGEPGATGRPRQVKKRGERAPKGGRQSESGVEITRQRRSPEEKPFGLTKSGKPIRKRTTYTPTKHTQRSSVALESIEPLARGKKGRELLGLASLSKKKQREQLKKLIAKYTEQGGKITQLRPGSARAVTPQKKLNKWEKELVKLDKEGGIPESWNVDIKGKGALEKIEKALETQLFTIGKGIGKVGQGKGKIFPGGKAIGRVGSNVSDVNINAAQIKKLHREGYTLEQVESAINKVSKGLVGIEARIRFKKQPMRKLLRTLRDAHPNIKKALLGKKKKPKKQTKALWKAPKKTRQAIKRQAGGPVHRGTGVALRGFGNAKYSNRLY
jgi:hypothetical protein